MKICTLYSNMQQNDVQYRRISIYTVCIGFYERVSAGTDCSLHRIDYVCVSVSSSSFSYKGVSYAVGESVYVPADTHRFTVKPHNTHKTKRVPTVSLTLSPPSDYLV